MTNFFTKTKLTRFFLVCFLLASFAANAQTYNINAGSVTITSNGTYLIEGTGVVTSNTITVSSGITANITLSNVKVNTTSACAFMMSGATVNLTLNGINTLTSESSNSGINVPYGAALTITAESTGSLIAQGGYSGAGIGCGYSDSQAGTVTINGGTVTAISIGMYGAGIGSSYNSNGGIITINGGTVTAQGGKYGAGLGGGYNDCGTVIITGGTVTATAGVRGAGIGGGVNGNGGTITISGGTVTATGGEEYDLYYGAGIGGGGSGKDGGNVTITGGTVIANAGGNASGIGGGYVAEDNEDEYFQRPAEYGSSGTLTLNGNAFVLASSVGDTDIDNKTGGILFNGNIGIMYGDVTLEQDAEIPSGATLTINEGQTLTVGAGVTLTNNGTIINNGTSCIINNGTINGINAASVSICTITPTPSAAHILYVKTDGTGDGSSWENAYPNLADPLLEAQTNTDIHEIWVAAGLYKPMYKAGTGTHDRDKAFVLVEGVKIYGGFAGGESSIDERDWGINVTTLSGDFNNDDIGFTNNEENAYHVVLCVTQGEGVPDAAPPMPTSSAAMRVALAAPPITSATVLDGFTVTGGNANGSGYITLNETSSVRNYGGGININGYSSPTLSNLIIIGNKADYGGGILCSYRASPILTNVIICGNTATYDGGGIAAIATAHPILTNVTISGNNATRYGGGIYGYDYGYTIKNCIVWGNESGYGSNIYVFSSYGGITYNYSLIGGEYISGTGNITRTDPLFVNASIGDYRLQPASPAIDAGSDALYTGLITDKDLAGNPRFVGSTIDMGAYEWQEAELPSDIVVTQPQGSLIQIHPNPTINIVTINGIQPNETVTITDLQGRIVLTANNTIINVSNLPSGVYLVRFGNSVEKLVKE
ncbi:MAG: T9SS type A sorting domain-containing protein [Prevotellaceae bacterium]|jgi:hypothetical protein|nr:T9SS type A sorting domain-containing protein [Prevotellaceae bacterium]